MIVDSHCHLDFPELYDDLENVIKRAEVAGVSNILTICTRLKNETKIRSIANNNPMIYYAAGSHPMSVADEPMVSVDDLLSIAKNPKMIGIGETGLDYYYTQETKATQIKSLEIHIEAARQAKLPLIIHSRSADKDMADILQNEFTTLKRLSPNLTQARLWSEESQDIFKTTLISKNVNLDPSSIILDLFLSFNNIALKACR